jgi:transcriptional regulator with XRE-family HTH domain
VAWVRLTIEQLGGEEAVAELIGKPVKTVQGWRLGRFLPLLEDAARLAEEAGVSLDEALGIRSGRKLTLPERLRHIQYLVGLEAEDVARRLAELEQTGDGEG